MELARRASLPDTTAYALVTKRVARMAIGYEAGLVLPEKSRVTVIWAIADVRAAFINGRTIVEDRLVTLVANDKTNDCFKGFTGSVRMTGSGARS